jgi:hypothetical protein
VYGVVVMKTRKESIQGTLSDLVGRFLYYDRKEDLPVESIEDAVKKGEISIADLVSQFESELREDIFG